MRGPARLVAEFQVRYGSKDEMFMGRGTDVSEKGLGFTGAKTFPPGSSLSIELHLDSAGAQWFKVQGIVRDVAQERMGVEFVDMAEPEKMRLLKAIYRASVSRHQD